MIMHQNKSQFIVQNIHNSPKYVPKEKRIHKAQENTLKDVKLDPAMKDLSYTWMGAFYTLQTKNTNDPKSVKSSPRILEEKAKKAKTKKRVKERLMNGSYLEQISSVMDIQK